MQFPENTMERKLYEKIVLGDNITERTGEGTVYRGEYYHLDYQPLRGFDNYNCLGVELVTRRNSDMDANDFPTVYVRFKNPSGTWGKILKSALDIDNSTKPFKERLTFQIDSQISAIMKAEYHINEVRKSARKIVECQIQIDKTVKEIVVDK